MIEPYADARYERCPHGIHHPHPCRECEDAPLTAEQEAEVQSCVTPAAAKPEDAARGYRDDDVSTDELIGGNS